MGRGKSQASLELVEASWEILNEIQPASVRAVCYQLFVRGLIGSMSKNDTNRISSLLVWAREEGEIPWGWFVDSSRSADRPATWRDPAQFAEMANLSYRRDAWQLQPVRIEVWSEKSTVQGTILPITQKYGVTFWPIHGYGGATFVRNAAMESAADAKPFKVFYCGDYDCSGLHMSQVDLPNRLERYQGKVELVRLALTESDIGSGELPFFSVEEKRGDTRYRWYTSATKLDRCWELDCLSPAILRERLEAAILAEIDTEAWERMEACSAAEQESLLYYLTQWKGLNPG